jgi:ABC-type transporter Mla subunit MlaD
MVLTANANGVMTKIGPVVDSVRTTVSNANETISSVRDPIQADLDELRKALADARVLISNLQEWCGRTIRTLRTRSKTSERQRRT